MTKGLKYRGNLAENTLPEMLYTIDRFRVPGIIEARRQGVVKRVYTRDGYIIHASSSDRQDSLGYHLERQGSLSEADLESLTKEGEATDKRFGVLLIEAGILSPVEVLTAIRQQIEAVVWSLFYWQDGEVTYGVGELKELEMVQIQLPIGQVIVHGIKRAPNARPLIAKLGRKDTQLEPWFQVEDLIEIGLEADDYKLLSMVDGKRSLFDLCSNGPRTPSENAKLLYALQVLNLIGRVGSSRAKDGRVKVQLRTTGDEYRG